MERGDSHFLSVVGKVTEYDLQRSLEQSSSTGNAAPGTQTSSASQGSLETGDKGDMSTKVSKGKETATEEVPRSGKLWRDPNLGKLWLWLTPPDHKESHKRDPPAPSNVLRINGPVVPLTAFKFAVDKEYLNFPEHIHVHSSQIVRHILDSNGKHGGLYWEQGGYEWIRNGIYPSAGQSLIMVGVSSYAACYRPREGPSRVEGPIRLFDDKAFPGVGPASLVNVLVVDENVGYSNSTWDRCTVAVIHCAAWEAAKPIEREVRIA